MKAVKAVKTEEKAKGEKVKGDKAKAKVTKDKLKKAEKPKVQKAEAEAPRDTLDWPKGLQSPLRHRERDCRIREKSDSPWAASHMLAKEAACFVRGVTVSGCKDKTVKKIVRGDFKFAGENHGRCNSIGPKS